MDKKQVHQIGKTLNKPVKFLKKNAAIIATALVSSGGSAIANHFSGKNKK